MYSKISETPIFKGISSDEISNILNSTHHQIKTYEAEAIIAFSGDECNNLFVLIEGSIRGEAIDYNEKIIKIEDVFAPDTFAEAFLFADQNNLLINIVANTKSKILIIHKEDLLVLFQSNKKILENYLNIISNRFVLVTKKLKFLSLRTIKAKLASHFIELSKKSKNNTIFFGKTQAELADYFGVTRPSLARTIKEMKDEGIIEVPGKMIRIIDYNKLKKLIE
ncbi:MAG: Crp/Fnr family transcriptional regulator [Bacteroidales bacterium]|nr:Crp/Fnr family transcriptional regulator [Bacteroidales bacterium]